MRVASRRFSRLLAGVVVAATLVLSACGRGAKVLSATAKTGNCPVCHMKVNTGDEWESEILFKGGSKLMFESPADMLRFYVTPSKYEVTDDQKNTSNIEQVLVYDYSTKRHVDGVKATLVYNSKVSGPMGPDFVPFESADAAASFQKANGGAAIGINQVTEETLRELTK